MSSVLCPVCEELLAVPAGAADGDRIDCPTCAGVTLRLVPRDGGWRGELVRRVSCPHTEREVELPDAVQPGDVFHCDGRPYRLTYAYGSYALEPLA